MPAGQWRHSAQAIFLNKKYTPVTKKANHQTWRNLLSDTSLLPNCNEQGINYITSETRGSSIVGKLRIGLLSNNETDCVTTDAFPGIGSHMYWQRGIATTGNSAGNKGGDRGVKNTPAFGYLFVR